MQKMEHAFSWVGYKLEARYETDARKELIRKVNSGEIPCGKYRLHGYLSMTDYRDHWFAEKLN